jgi:hypothetical protein
MSAGEPGWIFLLDGVIDIDLDQDGDEWAELVTNSLAESVHWSSYTASAPQRPTPNAPLFEMKVTSPALRAALWLVRTTAGVQAAVVGEGEEDEAEIESWRSALKVARDRLNRTAQDFAWHAAVGASGAVGQQNLAQEMRVGGLELSPGNVCFKMSGEPARPTFDPSVGVFPSWPVVVKGSARAVRWELASSIAARDLHLLSGLLTLICDYHWTVRQSPIPRSQPLRIPRCLPGDRVAEGVLTEEPEQPAAAGLVLPPWTSAAWQMCKARPEIACAVAAYHQGAELARRHPSYGFVAFVGAIEAIGKTFPRPEIKGCRTCGRGEGYAMVQFREALGLVMSASAAKEFCGRVYRGRSMTAHGGILFGTEPLLGSVEVSGVLRRDEPLDFRMRHLAPLQAVARDVVLKAIVAS